MIKQHLFELTPLGKADKDVRAYLKQGLEPHQFKRYETSLRHYRHLKILQVSLKILLYAGIATSIVATVGLNEAMILQKVASYIGTTVLLVLFSVTSYITMIRRESYHVQREILISKASMSDESSIEDIF